MTSFVKFIQKRLILQVLLVSLPVLFLGLFTAVILLQQSFSSITLSSRAIYQLFQTEVLQLENDLLELTDLKYDNAARIAVYKATSTHNQEKHNLMQQGHEIMGAIRGAVPLAENIVSEISGGADNSVPVVLTALRNIFYENAFVVLHWDRKKKFTSLAGQYGFSDDFSRYVEEAVHTGKTDWFEDNIGAKDILVSLIPYPRTKEVQGVFITVFDVSKAYSFFDQAERLSLSISASRLQEQKMSEGKKQREIFQKTRQEQNDLIAVNASKSQEVIADARIRLILLIGGCMIALIGISIFLFWWLGIRQVANLKKFLGEITNCIQSTDTKKQQNSIPHHGNNFSCLDNLLEKRLASYPQNEIGELSNYINYTLTSLQQSMVSKNRLQAEIDEKDTIATRLRENQQRLKTIFDSVQAGVAIIDASTREIVDINPAALLMIKADKEQVVGGKCDQFICSSEKGKCPIIDQSQKSDTSERTLIDSAGEEIDIIKTEAKVQLNGNNFIIASFVDISEIKKARVKLEQAMFAAEKANRIKSEFLANMSHEIRTPLNGVIGMTQLIAETQLDEDQLHLCQTINNEAESLLKVINEILDFSKIEAGKLDLEHIPFNPRFVVEQVTEAFALRVEQKGLEVLSFVSTDLPSHVIGDPGRLRQILMNLGGNSLKFTRKGEIYFTVERVQATDNEIVLKFAVHDTGIGIAPENLATIFDSFTQADGSTTRKYGGTGLGTTISKQLVELMNGEIGVESKEGQGSTFWFTIPFPIAVNDFDEKQQDISLEKLHALVVDDNLTNRFILESYLKSWGCSVELSADGHGALERVRKSEEQGAFFDFVILDCNMPAMDGLEFAKRVKGDSPGSKRNVPLIMLSSANPLIKCDKILEANIQGYIRKPVKKNDLEKIVKSVLGFYDQPAVKQIEQSHEDINGKTVRRKFNILLVEDYPTNQKIALRYLVNEGYNVDIAENGLQAIESFLNKSFDLILMDIQMPIMDGYGATRKIRHIESESELNSRIPIIAMTAHASTGYRDKCLDADMDDYVAKPLRKNKFIELVDQWLLADRETEKENQPDTGVSCSLIPAAMDRPPFDFDKAIESFMGDSVFLGEVIDGFFENLHKQLDDMDKALENKDFESLWIQAHTIKGGAYNLYAEQLGKAAFEVEKAAKEEDLACCSGNMTQLKSAATLFANYYRELRES